ncbi:MAG: beta-phosphoglucomutase [Bacteroidales bacterium]|jgi:beta-phosphoglucomutase|nr:beta-phosphoglucomutase [Bacteroidales bacterium]
MGNIKAVIFDLDGVIVDTAVFHYQAWKRLAREMGFDLTEAQNEQLKGISRMESLDILLGIGNIGPLAEEEKQRLATSKNEWYRENILKMTPRDILPGVQDFLESLKKANYRIAIGSSSKNAGTILERIGMKDTFDAVIDGTRISKSKPDPEVFLKGARELDIPPEQCVVFEDAESGIEAAKNAGMKTIGVGNPENLPEADLVIPGLEKAEISIIENI